MPEPNQDKDPTNINLSDLNKPKTKKTLPKLTNPFKKQTGPHRDDEGKFATKSTTGSGGLTAAKQFNWKRAAPLMAIITIVGGLFVYQSFAASFQTRGKVKSGTTYNCRIWGKENSVPTEYATRGARSNVHQQFLDEEYMRAFGVLPTFDPWETSEYNYWIDRAEALKQEYSGDRWRQSCGITWQIHNEILASTPGNLGKREEENAKKGSDVLAVIYAEQLRGGNGGARDYLRASMFTDFATLPVRRQSSSHVQAWDNGWPDKIKVCAIIYRPGGGYPAYETTISMILTGWRKEYILEKQTRLESESHFPKYEVCSDTLNTGYVTKVLPGGGTVRERSLPALSMSLDTLKITYQDPSKPHVPRQVTKQFRWDTNPNDYVLIQFSQYIIKKAE